MNKDMSVNTREYWLSEIEEFIRKKNNSDIKYWSNVLKLEELSQSRLSSIDVFADNDKDQPSGKPLVSVGFLWSENGDEFCLEFFLGKAINRTIDIFAVFIQMAKAVADFNGVSNIEICPLKQPKIQDMNWYRFLEELHFEEDKDDKDKWVLKIT